MRSGRERCAPLPARASRRQPWAAPWEATGAVPTLSRPSAPRRSLAPEGRGSAESGPGKPLGEFAVVTSHVLQLPDTSAFLSDKLKRLERLEPAAASTHGQHVKLWYSPVLTHSI